jgi:Rap1a immunity proteins
MMFFPHFVGDALTVLHRIYSNGLVRMGSYTGASSGVCVPVGVTVQKAARVVVQYIDGQAITRTDEDFRLLAFEALQAAWSCKN